MVNISKSENSIKIVFTDSDHYLYGNGEVEVPVNSLLLVIDESEMVTFKKLSGDPFLSFRADNSNLGTKAAIEQFYKDNMVGSTGGGGTGSGVTSGDVETMIDTALDDYYDKDEVDAGFDSVNATLSGKADTSAVTAVANDVQTVSGQVQTKLATSDFNAYSAATATALSGKQDKLVYYSENTEDGYADMIVATNDGDGNTTEQRVSIVGGLEIEMGNYQEYNDGQGNTGYTRTNIQLANPEINIYAESEDNGETESTYFNITPTSVTINGDNVLTDGMISTAITSGSTDSEIPTAKATYDAIQAGGGGGMDDDTQQLISTAFNDLNDRKADLTELTKYQKKGDYVKTPTLADYMTNDAFDEYATAKERIISGALNDLNDKFGGIRLVKISQTDYDNLATKDENTLYIINNVI